MPLEYSADATAYAACTLYIVTQPRLNHFPKCHFDSK